MLNIKCQINNKYQILKKLTLNYLIFIWHLKFVI